MRVHKWTVRLPWRQHDRVLVVGEATGRKPGAVVELAVDKYLEVEEPIAQQILRQRASAREAQNG